MRPETCPHCGAPVPPKAKACPECGSDEKTGWSEEAHSSGIDIPDDTFDYGDFVKREFGKPSPVPHGIHWFWWLIAVILLATFLWLWIR